MLSFSIKKQSSIFWQLVLTDLMIFRSSIVGSMINTAIMMFFVVGIATYLMPILGITPEYGPFMAWGAIPTACHFELFGLVGILISDIRAEKAISSRLILPIPTYLVFVAKGFSVGIKTIANAFTAALVGPAILAAGGNFSSTYISFWKLGLSIICLVIFIGFLAIFAASLAKDIYRLSSAWIRIITPMWYLGCTQFSWQTMATFSPPLAYICLLNPFVYVNEGVHSAALNPANYLNFWLCLAATIIMTGIFGILGIRRLKQQLGWV